MFDIVKHCNLVLLWHCLTLCNSTHSSCSDAETGRESIQLILFENARHCLRWKTLKILSFSNCCPEKKKKGCRPEPFCMSSFLTPWKWTTTAILSDLFLSLNPNVILETYLWSSVYFSQRYCGSTRLPRWTESTSWPSRQACEEQFGAVFTPSELKLAETYRWSKIRFLGFPKTILSVELLFG